MVHRGHSAHVTNCCFSCDTCKSRVIRSVGGGDRCAFVWKVVSNEKGGGGGGGGGGGYDDDY